MNWLIIVYNKCQSYIKYLNLKKKGNRLDKLKNLKSFFETIPDSNLEFFGAVVAIILTIIASILLYNWRDIKIIYYLSAILFLFIGMILVYTSHFRHVNPFWLSIILSMIVSFVTGIIIVVYIKFFKGDTGFSMPIAFISQNIIANIILKFKISK